MVTSGTLTAALLRPLSCSSSDRSVHALPQGWAGGNFRHWGWGLEQAGDETDVELKSLSYNFIG